jgi:hypothetical protein
LWLHLHDAHRTGLVAKTLARNPRSDVVWRPVGLLRKPQSGGSASDRGC